MGKNYENNRLNDVIETVMKNLNGVIDVNTVIGKPLKTDTDETIIPISKVTFGLLCGGGEYGKIGIFKKGSDLPYSAGNGAVVSIKPCGFLVKNANSEYKMINIANSSYEKFFEKATDFISENLTIKDDNYE